jgi:DNA-dependent RNA polymerase auxiliary subunit epsilon
MKKISIVLFAVFVIPKLYCQEVQHDQKLYVDGTFEPARVKKLKEANKFQVEFLHQINSGLTTKSSTRCC